MKIIDKRQKEKKKTYVRDIPIGSCFSCAKDDGEDITTKSIFIRTDHTPHDFGDFTEDSYKYPFICICLDTGCVYEFDDEEEVILVSTDVHVTDVNRRECTYENH